MAPSLAKLRQAMALIGTCMGSMHAEPKLSWLPRSAIGAKGRHVL